MRLDSFALFFLCLMTSIICSSVRLSAETSDGAAADQTKTGAGAITGRIMIKGGGPLSGGRVLFYDSLSGPPPMNNQARRVPDFRFDTDAEGKFWAELPPGRYYLQAIKKNSLGEHGLQNGGYILFSLDDKDRPKEYVIKSGNFLDIGTISGAMAYKKVNLIVKTGIEGVIMDMDGKPVEGATVFAFGNQTTAKKPLFASQQTGRDGKYILAVPEGTYYLRVRSNLGGGPPEPGQIVGILGEQVPAGISVKTGEIKNGINIKVIRFRGRGPAPGAGPKQQ